MRYRTWSLILLVGLSACANPSSPMSPTPPGTVAALTGIWSATVSDPTGSFMGSGTGGPSVASSWTMVQNGSTISGTWNAPGMMRGQVSMTGTFDGHLGTFTMNMPAGSMMGTCAASASGTFEVNEARTELHCQYSGSNTCSGPFQHGDMMLRR